MEPCRSSVTALNLSMRLFIYSGQAPPRRSKPLSWMSCSQELTRLAIPMSKCIIAAASYPDEGDIGLHISLVSQPC